MTKTLNIIYSTKATPVVMGPKFAAFVAHAAEAIGYDVAILEITTAEELERFCQTRPDLVFLGMKYVYDGSERVLSTTILDRYGLPHTNSSESMKYDLDKELAKQRIAEAGLATSSAVTVNTEDDVAAVSTLTPPLFIKPIDAGGAVGVDELSFASSHDDAMRNVRVKLQTPAAANGLLVEEFLAGREYSVGIINQTHDTYLRAGVAVGYGDPEANFLTPDIKRDKSGRYTPLSDESEREEVLAFAAACYRALGCDGYARIDLRRDKNGVLNFLEVNLIPGLGNAGIIMTLAFEYAYGFSKNEVIQKIIAYAEYRARPEQE